MRIGEIVIIIGIIGIVMNIRSYIIILLSLELIIIGIVEKIVYISTSIEDIEGIKWAIIIITIAAAETAVALTGLIVFNKYNK